MLYTGEFLYVLSLKVKHVLRLICGSGSTWNPFWVLGYNMFSNGKVMRGEICARKVRDRTGGYP